MTYYKNFGNHFDFPPTQMFASVLKADAYGDLAVVLLKMTQAFVSVLY